MDPSDGSVLEIEYKGGLPCGKKFIFCSSGQMQLKGKRLNLSRYCSRYVPAFKGGWSVARIWQMQGRSEIWTLSEGDIGHCVN